MSCAGTSYLKLTMPLVNDLLKFQMAILQIQLFLLQKRENPYVFLLLLFFFFLFFFVFFFNTNNSVFAFEVVTKLRA